MKCALLFHNKLWPGSSLAPPFWCRNQQKFSAMRTAGFAIRMTAFVQKNYAVLVSAHTSLAGTRFL
jgi:hypothetical protein